MVMTTRCTPDANTGSKRRSGVDGGKQWHGFFCEMSTSVSVGGQQQLGQQQLTADSAYAKPDATLEVLYQLAGTFIQRIKRPLGGRDENEEQDSVEIGELLSAQPLAPRTYIKQAIATTRLYQKALGLAMYENLCGLFKPMVAGDDTVACFSCLDDLGC